MQKRSKSFDEFVRHSALLVTVVEWQYNDGPWVALPFVDGSVTCDRKAATRWTLDLDLTTNTDTSIQAIAAYGTRLRVRRGVKIPRVGVEYVGWGVYRIQSVQKSRTRVKVKAYSLEKQIDDSRFPRPRRVGQVLLKTPKKPKPDFDPTGVVTSYRDVIEDLVLEAVPDSNFAFLSREVNDYMVSVIEEKERWGLLDGGQGDKISIAQSLGVEMFYNGGGTFVVRDLPRISDSIDINLDGGKYPVLIEPTEDSTRDSVYNLVVASGSTTDGKKPVGPAFAWDSNRLSATYAGPDPVNRPEDSGPFGVVPRFYSSSLLKDTAACQRMANNTLRESMGRKENMAFTMFSNPALEPGDVVTKGGKRYLVESWQAGLRGATMSCTTRSSKEDLSDVSISGTTT